MTRRPAAAVFLGFLLAGCLGKKDPNASGESLTIDQVDIEAARGIPIEQGPWEEEGGLRLTVPSGWSGRTGPSGSSLLLTLEHARTGVVLEIWAFEATGTAGVRPRPYCEWMFSDDSSHRIVPVLAPATTGTCVAEEPGAPVVQGWFGIVGPREVHAEVVYPHGRVIEGRQAVEPLLHTLSWR